MDVKWFTFHALSVSLIYYTSFYNAVERFVGFYVLHHSTC